MTFLICKIHKCQYIQNEKKILRFSFHTHFNCPWVKKRKQIKQDQKPSESTGFNLPVHMPLPSFVTPFSRISKR